MSEDGIEEGMAECGACRTVVPIDSEECPSCGISFTGVSDTSLGECGACGALVPIDSTSCAQCGVVFVADDVISILGDWLNATGLSVADLFKRFDENDDGVIEAHEFKSGLLALNIADLPESQVDRLVKALDDDGNGVIDLEELESTFTPPDNTPAKEIPPAEDEGDEGAEDTEGDSGSTEEDSDSTEDTPDEDEDEDSEVEDESADDSGESGEDETPDDDDDDDDDDSEDTEESEDADEEEESGDSDEEEEADEEEEVPDSALGRMIKHFKDSGYGVQEAFEHMDVNSDGEIDGEEMTKALTEFGGGVISNEDVEAVMADLDLDENGVITIDELMVAFGEEPVKEEESVDEKTDEKPEKAFPSDLQKKLMSKKANDIFWPILHAAFAIFMLLWVLNGLGFFVDGTGGPVVHSGDPFIDDSNNLINDGDSTTCGADTSHKCGNSLTPLSGKGSLSMPAGFYWDGVLFIVLGLAGLGGSLYGHLVLMKQWRKKAKSDDPESQEKTDDSTDEDSEDGDEKESDEEEDGEEDSGEDEPEDSKDEDDDESDDDDDSEDDDDDSEDDDDDDEDDDDDDEEDIDVGSRVGVEIDGEEVFGTILEFNDDDDTVIIEDEETGDEVEAPQDSMFLE